MTDQLADTSTASDALRRRTVLTGAAWSAPVICFAFAAPAAAASEPVTGTIVFSPDTYRGVRNGNQVDFPPLTGIVTVSRGPMPAKAFLNFSGPDAGRTDYRRDAGRYTPVDATTGRFQFDGIYNAVVDGDNPFGFAYAGIEEEDADGATFGYTVAQLIG